MIANVFSRLAIASMVMLGIGGCGQTERPESKAPADASKPTSIKSFTMRGTVREVDPKQHEVTIAHEAMPGFMGAMTMPFTIDAPDALDDVRPGDEVEGKISVTFQGDLVKKYQLETLEVTNPAPVELKLNVGPGGASLQEKKQVLSPGHAVPDFTMTTQEGKALKLSDLRGKVVVLTFIYTRCPLPDFCPASDAAFGELAKILDVQGRKENVRLLSISFDPEHDTPPILAAHAKRRGAEPPLWTFAVASHDELRKVAELLGLTYGPMKNEIIHNMTTSVIDPDGKLVQLVVGKAGTAWTVSDLAKRVVGTLRESR